MSQTARIPVKLLTTQYKDKLATAIVDCLDVDYVLVDTYSFLDGDISVDVKEDVLGQIAGRDCMLIDDIMVSGRSLQAAISHTTQRITHDTLHLLWHIATQPTNLLEQIMRGLEIILKHLKLLETLRTNPPRVTK